MLSFRLLAFFPQMFGCAIAVIRGRKAASRLPPPRCIGASLANHEPGGWSRFRFTANFTYETSLVIGRSVTS